MVGLNTIYLVHKKYIISKRTLTNIDLYYFTYTNGHIAEHTNSWLRDAKQRKMISYSGHTKITWDSVKNNEIVMFNWLK